MCHFIYKKRSHIHFDCKWLDFAWTLSCVTNKKKEATYSMTVYGLTVDEHCGMSFKKKEATYSMTVCGLTVRAIQTATKKIKPYTVRLYMA